jgi:hypothetical protein
MSIKKAPVSRSPFVLYFDQLFFLPTLCLCPHKQNPDCCHQQNYPPVKAAAPLTISVSSVVMAACLAWL